MNPRTEASERLGGAYEVRVLEPSPPAVSTEPFADDPVARGEVPSARELVSPVSSGDRTWDELAADDPDLARWVSDRWLGAWRRLQSVLDPVAFGETRASLHAVAEHVIAPARHAANGKIGLRFTKDGFGTPYFGADEQVRVAGTDLVHVHGSESAATTATTVAAAAAVLGREPGAPDGIYEPSTRLAPDHPLSIDPRSAGLIAAWFGFGASVLEQLRSEAEAGDSPSLVQLWPEHFDLSFDRGDEAAGARGTFGASPGDAQHSDPYLYVTHWAAVAPDPFWNDTAFGGASLSLGALAASHDQRLAALTFLRRGARLLHRR